MKRLLFHILFALIFCSCNSTEFKDQGKKSTFEEIKLSENAVKNFYQKIGFMTTALEYSKLDEAYFIKPNFNPNFISKSDTDNFSYFKLIVDTNKIFVGVHRKLCYALFVHNHRGYFYPDFNKRVNSDFSFLNDENLPYTFDCPNNEKCLVQSSACNKNIIGSWEIDSVLNSSIKLESKIQSLQISEERVIINNSINHLYEQKDEYLVFDDSKQGFFLLFINEYKMIFVGGIDNNVSVYYCSKANYKNIF